MTYLVLARKWRPQDFSSLIGQEPIVTALRNALTENRIAQAYLFSGIRGVGKTSAARVLAKALNCERGPAADPCNECQTCLEITGGSDLDVIEVDAATYSKVEQVRELTESLRYGPAKGRYKVVVLDEVHRLSRQAFDALLKIVEEPPAHLVFIFATTEIDAVPATILSRCQEFQFRRVPSGVLAAHMRKLSDAEGLTVSDTALRLIARAGDGSVRDSIALLDQLANFGKGTIGDQDAKDLLGGLDAAIFIRLLNAICDGAPAEITAVVRDIEDHGWDPHNVYSQFIGYCRDALHLAMGGAPDSIELPLEEAESLAAVARPAGYENLLRLLQLLLSSEPTVRRSEFGGLALEIALLRAAELPKLTRVEELLAGGAASPSPARTKPAPPAAPAKRSAPTAPSGPEPVVREEAPTEESAPAAAHRTRPTPSPEAAPPALAAQSQPPPARESVPSTEGQAEPPEPNAGTVEHFRELLSLRRQSLAAHINRATLTFSSGQLEISPPAGDTLLAGALARKGNVEILETALRETFGENTGWSLVAPQPAVEKASVAPREEERVDDLAEVREHPSVQAVLDIFDGTLEGVQPSTRES